MPVAPAEIALNCGTVAIDAQEIYAALDCCFSAAWGQRQYFLNGVRL